MKTTNPLRIIMLAVITALFVSCSPQSKIHGTAADKSGTNGATNGNGKIPAGNAHQQRN